MYYPCSENKGADQLRSYCEADLRLCFRIGNNPVFSRRGSIILDNEEIVEAEHFLYNLNYTRIAAVLNEQICVSQKHFNFHNQK